MVAKPHGADIWLTGHMIFGHFTVLLRTLNV